VSSVRKDLRRPCRGVEKGDKEMKEAGTEAPVHQETRRQYTAHPRDVPMGGARKQGAIAPSHSLVTD
jgi:hypothetical protein